MCTGNILESFCQALVLAKAFGQHYFKFRSFFPLSFFGSITQLSNKGFYPYFMSETFFVAVMRTGLGSKKQIKPQFIFYWNIFEINLKDLNIMAVAKMVDI